MESIWTSYWPIIVVGGIVAAWAVLCIYLLVGLISALKRFLND